MSEIKTLDVEVDILGSLDVDVDFGKTIVKIIGSDLYSGPFEFYPSGEVQVVPIGGKTSTKDVIFKAVEGSLEITENGSYDVTNLSGVDISIEPDLQTKSVNPSEESQTVTYDDDYDGLSSVSVGAIPSSYIGSAVNRRSSSDLTSSGATVNVPSGYFAENASKAVQSGQAGTPIASKGTVSNHSIAVTPSVSNSEGYISGGTLTGNAITVSASELVSGTKEVSITDNGTTIEDVTNYADAEITVNVVNQDYEDALVALGVTEDLTDSIEALTTYANGVTGESDTTLSDAVESLADGCGGGGGSYTGLEYVYANDGSVDSLIWHGGGKIANANFQALLNGVNRNIPITFPDKPTLIGNSAFYNSRLRIDWTDMTEVLAIGSGGFRVSYTTDCTADIVRLPKLDGLTHDGLTNQNAFAYTGSKSPGAYYFDSIKTIPREFFNNINKPAVSLTFGSLGHAVESCGWRPFNNSAAATVATVTTYTTGEYLDTVRENLETNTGKGTFTFVYKASEATTYNGTSYSAGDTITV